MTTAGSHDIAQGAGRGPSSWCTRHVIREHVPKKERPNRCRACGAGFDFIECFTTTFLRAHSWLNWVDEDDDEDEVGLKEKPEDTRYIKKITSK